MGSIAKRRPYYGLPRDARFQAGRIVRVLKNARNVLLYGKQLLRFGQDTLPTVGRITGTAREEGHGSNRGGVG